MRGTRTMEHIFFKEELENQNNMFGEQNESNYRQSASVGVNVGASGSGTSQEIMESGFRHDQHEHQIGSGGNGYFGMYEPNVTVTEIPKNKNVDRSYLGMFEQSLVQGKIPEGKKPMARTTCHICGQTLTKQNLKRHVKLKHGQCDSVERKKELINKSIPAFRDREKILTFEMVNDVNLKVYRKLII